MSVEFLTDEEAARYGRFPPELSRVELEVRVFMEGRAWTLAEGPKRLFDQCPRLSPLGEEHINVAGRHHFPLREHASLRPLRDRETGEG